MKGGGVGGVEAERAESEGENQRVSVWRGRSRWGRSDGAVIKTSSLRQNLFIFGSLSFWHFLRFLRCVTFTF
jgi:hypothetical protein